MEIRALTGFDLETRQKYGRSYTPLNGTNTLLGVYNPDEEKFIIQEPKTPNTDPLPWSQNPDNWFYRYKPTILLAGGIIATYLLYKKFK